MDPVANLITSIKNSQAIGKKEATVPFSKFKLAILKLLSKEGFITDVQKLEEENHKMLKIILKYKGEQPMIRHLKRISTPAVKIYAKAKRIPRPLQGLGDVILTTPQGVMMGKEAQKKGLGGEVICEIY